MNRQNTIFFRLAVLAIIFVVSLSIVSMVGAIDPTLDGLIIHSSPDSSAHGSGALNIVPPGPPPADSLLPGQILVEKSVVHNTVTPGGASDGTVTVTLSVWGATFPNDMSSANLPLKQMSDGAFVTITDNIGRLGLEGSLPAAPTGTTLADNGSGVITWNITDQNVILNAPLTVSYTLTVATNGPSFEWDSWYLTGTADAKFDPVVGNPYYYTTSETTFDSFTLAMSWNGGNGL
ncbi:MAG: hypothetical protein FWE87_06215, partial [Coriobacteriia bacterium]|nr:hypothetical protein [Coriobacteriia bacterium]